MTIYKNTEVPSDSGTAGVRQCPRGIHKGKWQAFYKDKEGMIFSGIPREQKYQAVFDLSLLKTKTYVSGDIIRNNGVSPPEQEGKSNGE